MKKNAAKFLPLLLPLGIIGLTPKTNGVFAERSVFNQDNIIIDDTFESGRIVITDGPDDYTEFFALINNVVVEPTSENERSAIHIINNSNKPVFAHLQFSGDVTLISDTGCSPITVTSNNGGAVFVFLEVAESAVSSFINFTANVDMTSDAVTAIDFQQNFASGSTYTYGAYFNNSYTTEYPADGYRLNEVMFDGGNPSISFNLYSAYGQELSNYQYDTNCYMQTTVGTYIDYDQRYSILSEVTYEENHCWETEIISDECGLPGLQKRTCSVCNLSEEIETPAREHDWSEWKIVNPETCTEDGLKERTCLMCQEKETAVIPHFEDHDWYITNDPIPNCLEGGIYDYRCSRCGETYSEYRPAFESHEFGEWEINEESTCEHPGTQVRICDRCGDIETQEIPQLSHNMELIYSEVTNCLSGGTEVYRCSICLHEETTSVNPKDHEFGDWEIGEEAACDKEGFKVRVCTVCGERETAEIPTLPHNWGEWEIVKNSTCSETGTRQRICLQCNAMDTEEIPMSDHDWQMYMVSSNPTCTEGGTEVYKCRSCGEEKTEATNPIPDAHSFGEWEITVPASCQEVGIKERICLYCGYSEQDEIPMIDHEWIKNDEITGTCVEGGAIEYICKNCDETKVEDSPLDPNNHEWGEWVITQEGNCITKSISERTCNQCGETETKEGEVAGHSYSFEQIGEATCITPAGGHLVCTVCGDVIEAPGEFEYDDSNHEGVRKLVVDVAATTEHDGKGHFEWSCCGLIDEEIVINKLTPEASKDVVSDIIGINTEKDPDEPVTDPTPIEEAIESIKEETLLEVAEEVNQTFEIIANLTGITEETKKEYIETVVAATESAVIAGAKLDNVVEEAEKIVEKLPENITIDIGDKLARFYQMQFDLILGKITDPNKSNPQSAVNKANESTGGIDYTEGADVYKKVGEFIDDTVGKMTDAASLVRQCSMEKVSAAVNDYIDIISVKSFRSFDKQAADLEFADNAYKAILINMQEQTIANLDASYSELSSSLSGKALEDLKEEYDAQKAICEDLEEFEIFVVEIMRQKCNSILNEKYSNNLLTFEDYSSLYIGETDAEFESFKTTYKNIFYCWALGDAAESYGFTNSYNITLQELTDAAITNTSLQKKKLDLSEGLTSTEIVVISVLGGSAAVSFGALAFLKIAKKRKETIVRL
ncbi:MAG: hypothetical protein MJZ37_01840 [Bacilli bacterium]|nr:hypothetical protein [Bacilli bacterium]